MATPPVPFVVHVDHLARPSKDVNTYLNRTTIGGRVAQATNVGTLGDGSLGDTEAKETVGEQVAGQTTDTAASLFERHKTGMLIGIGASIVGAFGMIAFLSTRDKDGRTQNPIGDGENDSIDAILKNERALFRSIDTVFCKKVFPAFQGLQEIYRNDRIDQLHDRVMEGTADASEVVRVMKPILFSRCNRLTTMGVKREKNLELQPARISKLEKEMTGYEAYVRDVFNRSAYKKLFEDKFKNKTFDQYKEVHGIKEDFVKEYDSILLDVVLVSKMMPIHDNPVPLKKRGAWLASQIVPILRAMLVENKK